MGERFRPERSHGYGVTLEEQDRVLARYTTSRAWAAAITSGPLAKLPFEIGAPAFREERRRRNKGGFQAFSPSLSKSRLFLSKLFQRKLWRFCGISMGCKPSKPKVSLSKYFRDVRLLSAVFSTTLRPFRPPFAVWRSAVRGRAFAWQVWAMLMVTVDPDRENPKPNWNSVYWKGNVENSMRDAARDLLGVREGRRQFQLRPRRLTPRVRRLKVLRPPPHHLGAADDARLLSGGGAAPIPSRSGLLRRDEFTKFGGPRFRTLSRRQPGSVPQRRSGAAPGLSVGFSNSPGRPRDATKVEEDAP
jgi:hypothetical protein